MRVLTDWEVGCVAGGGAGQEIAQCIADSTIESGWVGITMTIGGMFTGGASAYAFWGGTFVGCSLLYMNGCL